MGRASRAAAYAGYALLVYALCVVGFYPYASTAERLLLTHAPVGLQLGGLSATPWRVSGEALTVPLPDRAPLVLRDWMLVPRWSALWRGRQELGLFAATLGGHLQGTASRVGDAIAIDLRLRGIEATALQASVGWPLLNLQGQADGQMELRYRPGEPLRHASFHLELPHGSIHLPSLSGELALGHTALDGAFTGRDLAAQGTTRDGELELDVAVTLHLEPRVADSRLEGRGVLRPTARTPEALRDWMQGLAPSGPSGVAFKLSGTAANPQLALEHTGAP
jgi:type II secretion system protein N